MNKSNYASRTTSAATAASRSLSPSELLPTDSCSPSTPDWRQGNPREEHSAFLCIPEQRDTKNKHTANAATTKHWRKRSKKDDVDEYVEFSPSAVPGSTVVASSSGMAVRSRSLSHSLHSSGDRILSSQSEHVIRGTAKQTSTGATMPFKTAIPKPIRPRQWSASKIRRQSPLRTPEQIKSRGSWIAERAFGEIPPPPVSQDEHHHHGQRQQQLGLVDSATMPLKAIRQSWHEKQCATQLLPPAFRVSVNKNRAGKKREQKPQKQNPQYPQHQQPLHVDITSSPSSCSRGSRGRISSFGGSGRSIASSQGGYVTDSSQDPEEILMKSSFPSPHNSTNSSKHHDSYQSFAEESSGGNSGSGGEESDGQVAVISITTTPTSTALQQSLMKDGGELSSTTHSSTSNSSRRWSSDKGVKDSTSASGDRPPIVVAKDDISKQSGSKPLVQQHHPHHEAPTLTDVSKGPRDSLVEDEDLFFKSHGRVQFERPQDDLFGPNVVRRSWAPKGRVGLSTPKTEDKEITNQEDRLQKVDIDELEEIPDVQNDSAKSQIQDFQRTQTAESTVLVETELVVKALEEAEKKASDLQTYNIILVSIAESNLADKAERARSVRKRMEEKGIVASDVTKRILETCCSTEGQAQKAFLTPVRKTKIVTPTMQGAAPEMPPPPPPPDPNFSTPTEINRKKPTSTETNVKKVRFSDVNETRFIRRRRSISAASERMDDPLTPPKRVTELVDLAPARFSSEMRDNLPLKPRRRDSLSSLLSGASSASDESILSISGSGSGSSPSSSTLDDSPQSNTQQAQLSVLFRLPFGDDPPQLVERKDGDRLEKAARQRRHSFNQQATEELDGAHSSDTRILPPTRKSSIQRRNSISSVERRRAPLTPPRKTSTPVDVFFIQNASRTAALSEASTLLEYVPKLSIQRGQEDNSSSLRESAMVAPGNKIALKTEVNTEMMGKQEKKKKRKDRQKHKSPKAQEGLSDHVEKTNRKSSSGWKSTADKSSSKGERRKMLRKNKSDNNPRGSKEKKLEEGTTVSLQLDKPHDSVENALQPMPVKEDEIETNPTKISDNDNPVIEHNKFTKSPWKILGRPTNRKMMRGSDVGFFCPFMEQETTENGKTSPPNMVLVDESSNEPRPSNQSFFVGMGASIRTKGK